MYGMVNKAVEDLVCATHGEAMWEAVKARAGVEVDVFISNEGYPDEMTYRLVTAASELSGTPPDQILRAFGEHWVLKTAREGYGDLLDAGGRTLAEFLVNLPNFHSRVVMIYPNLKPPRFEVSDVQERSLRLHYHTHRPGLAAFVIGLLEGLGKQFQTPVRVRQIRSREQGAGHDEFDVAW